MIYRAAPEATGANCAAPETHFVASNALPGSPVKRQINFDVAIDNWVRRHRGLGPIVSLPLTRANLIGKLPSAAPGIRQKQAKPNHTLLVPLGSQPAPPALDMNDAFAHKTKGAD